LAMGMAAVTGFLAVRMFAMFVAANVRLQNWSLKRGGCWQRSGQAFASLALVWFTFFAHSGAVQWFAWRGHASLEQIRLGDEVWRSANTWWDGASEENRTTLTRAIKQLTRADAWGLASTPAVLRDLTWAHLAQGETEPAEAAVRRLLAVSPDQPEVHRGLGGILRKTGRTGDAVTAYEAALRVDPQHTPSRLDLVDLFRSLDRMDEAIDQLSIVVRDNPRHHAARYQLATARLARVPTHSHAADLSQAIDDLRRLVADQQDFADAHYNLGVAVFMSGDPAAAATHVREAVRLAPSDAQAQAFLKVVEAELTREAK